METLVGQALIEIRATWDKVGADAQAALGVVRTEIEKAEAGISASVGATVREVEASATEMAGAVKAATDEVGIAWVGAADASDEFAVSQGEVRAAIRGSIADAQSFAASTDGMVAGFLSAERAGTQFATTETSLLRELKVATADETQALEGLFTGFATTGDALRAQILAMQQYEVGVAGVAASSTEAATASASLASRIEIIAPAAQGAASSMWQAREAEAALDAEMGSLTVKSAGYAAALEAVALQQRAAGLEADGLALGVDALMRAIDGITLAEAREIVQTEIQNRVLAEATAKTEAQTVAVSGLRGAYPALGAAIRATAIQEQGLLDVMAARAEQLGVVTLTEAQATAVTNAYTTALRAQFVETGRVTNVSGAMKSALKEVSDGAGAMKTALKEVSDGAGTMNGAFSGADLSLRKLRSEFNNTLHTVRNFTFVFAGIGAAVSAVTIAIADHVQKLYNMGQVFGLTASEISAFDMLAKSTGETVEAVSSSMRMLEKNFLGVGQGSKVAAVGFNALGIETAATGHSTASAVEIYRQMADTLSLLPDGETKVALGTAVMGRGFEEMIPVMNQGSAGMDLMTERSHALGTQLTTLDMLVSNEVAGMWSRFKESLLGVGYAVEKNLAPALMEFLGTLTQWIAKNRELLGQNIAEFVRNVGSAFGGAVSAIRDNASSLRTVASAALEAAAAYKAINFLYSAESIQKVAMAAYGLAGTMSNPLTIALTGVSALVLAGVHAYDEYASALDRSAQAVRDFQRELDRMTPAERAADGGLKAMTSTVERSQAAVNETKSQLEYYNTELAKSGGTSQHWKTKIEQATATLAKQQAELEYNEKGLKAVAAGHKAAADSTDTLSAASARAEIQQNLLKSAFRDLELAAKGNTQPLAQNVEGMQALDDVLKRAGGDAPKTVDGLIAMAKTGKLTAGVVHEFAQAFGVADEEINKALGLFLKFDAATLETSKGAHGAAAAVEKLDAQIAKIRADTVAIQIDQLSAAMKRMAPSQAMEQLPALMQLVSDKFDYARVQVGFETDALVKNAEKTKDVAQRSEMLEAAHVKQAASLEKLTAEESAYREKLVATSLGLEDGVKFIQNYDQTVSTLTASIESLNAAALQDQIKTITDNWKTLDTATRESQLPEVLDLIAQRYEALGKKAEEADQALLDQAQHLVDLRGAILDVAIEQGDANKVSEAANALQDAWAKQTEVSTLVTQKHSAEIGKLAVEQGREEKAARDAAAGVDYLKVASDSANKVTDDFAKSIVDLAFGMGSLKDVAKSLGSSILNDLTSSLTSGLGSMLKTGLADIGNMAAGGLADVLSPGVTQAASEAGMSGAEALVGTLTDGIASMMPDAIVGALGAGGTAAAIVAAVAGIGVGIAAAFGAFEGPTIQQQVARMLSKQIKKGFKDPEVFAAIDAGLESVGLYLGEGLGTVMVKAPKRLGLAVGEAFAELGADSSYKFSDGFYQDMQEHGTQLIHSSIQDVLHVFYKDITTDVATGIQQSAVAAGSAIAKELGFVGDKAIKFAQQWSIAFIGMMQQAGKGADEILTALHRIDASLGTSQELVASFQRLQAAMIDAGVDMDALYAKINEQLKMITGKKVHVGNLEEVLNAVGGDASRALGVIENAMDLAGIKVEKFTGQLSDVVLAISGDAGTAIKEAGQDFRDFGSDADGTAEILRQKVLTALDNVIKSAEELGYSTESIDAFKTAIGLIPPEMMKSSDFVNALRHDVAKMAAESHMSVADLVNSIDPPLPDAIKSAILATHDLGKALGELSGAPLSSIKEITDRMKQFSASLYTTIEEGGKQVKKLTAFGEQVVGDLVSAVGGMWNTITEDGVIAKDEIAGVFGQLAMIPEEVFNDPSVQAAVHELLAKIGEQTGDATLIALAASSTITKEQLDQATKEYDQWVKDHPPPPPPATTPTDGSTPSDGTTPTDPTKDPTGEAAGAPPPQPVPPETTASYQTLADTATEYTKAVLAGRDAFEALTQGVVVDAAQILAAIRPIYGTPDDEGSFSSIARILGDITTFLPDDATPAFKDFGINASAAVSSVFEAAVNAKSAMDSLAGDYTVTVHYETVGAPPTPPVTPPSFDVGGIVPGPIGAPTLAVVHGGEPIIPADTFSQMLRGDSFTLPADIAARLSASHAMAPIARGATTSRAPTHPGHDATHIAIRMSRQDAADAMVAPIFVRLEEAQGAGRVAFKDAKGRPVSIEVDPHTRGKARVR